MISAVDALQRLREGNHRFVNGESETDGNATHQQRADMTGGQQPFAIVLACSDSRIPTELVFDQDIGGLFVIRVAGNVVAPTQLGSIEYAATQLGTRLVVVLGHSNCGAVTASLKDLLEDHDMLSPNLRAIVDRIQPAVESILTLHKDESADVIIDKAVRANIANSVDRLLLDSPVIADLVEQGDLQVRGAEYSIETGIVDFLGE